MNTVEVPHGSSIKLVKKSTFRTEAFSNIESGARAVIDSAKDGDILALTLTVNSPLKIIQARIFNRDSFDDLLAL